MCDDFEAREGCIMRDCVELSFERHRHRRIAPRRASHFFQSLLSEAAKRGQDPRSVSDRLKGYRKRRRAATPRGRGPSLCLPLLRTAPRRFSSGCRGRALAPFIRRCFAGLRSPADLAVPTALLRVLRSVPATPAPLNSSATNVEIQGGKTASYGDGTADGTYGSSRLPSHGCETIPSTIGAMPASNGPSGCADLPPPPIEIWVPFAGPLCMLPWTTFGTLLPSPAAPTYPPRTGSGYRTSQPVQIV